MVNVFIYAFATLITFPFLATWIVYMIATFLTVHKLKAFHIAVQWTAIWYIIAVSTLNNIYFNRSFSGGIVIFLLIILSCIIIYQRSTNVNIHIRRAVMILCRFCFLLFGTLYICFAFYSIGLYIVQ